MKSIFLSAAVAASAYPYREGLMNVPSWGVGIFFGLLFVIFAICVLVALLRGDDDEQPTTTKVVWDPDQPVPVRMVGKVDVTGEVTGDIDHTLKVEGKADENPSHDPVRVLAEPVVVTPPVPESMDFEPLSPVAKTQDEQLAERLRNDPPEVAKKAIEAAEAAADAADEAAKAAEAAAETAADAANDAADAANDAADAANDAADAAAETAADAAAEAAAEAADEAAKATEAAEEAPTSLEEIGDEVADLLARKYAGKTPSPEAYKQAFLREWRKRTSVKPRFVVDILEYYHELVG